VKQTLLTALPLAITLCSCATDSYGSGPNAGKRAVYGAAAGAAIGALAGPALGADAFGGAAMGAIVGGTAGALIKGPRIHGRQYYRDTRGYCYYVDRNGKAKYDGSVRC
jgi:uncharacterized membrane protein